MKSPDKKD